jgi:hypothetical protein
MDFKLVLDRLLTAFRRQDIRYALIGGLALGAWGVARGTVDIDFVIHRDDRDKVDEIMQGLGYECRYSTDNVSQYLSRLRVFGEVDFFYAFRTPSLGMLERAEERKLFGGLISIRVLRLEDLIGFKVQAIVNDESRKSADMADIESLLDLHKTAVDWSLIEDYFNLFGLNDLFKELRGRYG